MTLAKIQPQARFSFVAALLGAGALACSDALPTHATGNQAGNAGQAGAGGGSGSGAGGSAALAGSGGTSVSGGASLTAGSSGTPAQAGGGSAGVGGMAGMGGVSGGAAGGLGGSGGTADEGWKPLLSGTLDGWTPSPGAAALFAAAKLDGQDVIHVYPTQTDQSEQPTASLRTNDSYGSYVFHVEYKWGVNRFGERKQSARDNGICFHICNNPAQVWPESIEFQLGSQAWPGDWVSGNIFMLINKTRAQWPFATMNGQEVFSETGTKKSIGAPTSYYKALVPAQHDIADGWNIVELTVHGSKDAEYKVNGTVVNRVFDMECNEAGSWKPLDHGPIALQAEFAEVYFRNVRIKVLE